MKVITRLTVFIVVCLMFGMGLSGCDPASSQTSPPQEAAAFGLAIHGGAGTILRSDMTPEREQEFRAKLTEALQTGHTVLADGGTSLDAVVATLMVMEDSPLFNAAKGAVFTSEGTVELDASIMDGQTRQAGAIAGVKHIRNPITLARLVMEDSPHVMMVGSGAEAFAQENGFGVGRRRRSLIRRALPDSPMATSTAREWLPIREPTAPV